MLGFYNYTVIITYLSVVSAVVGMTFSCTGDMKKAIFCLMFSGFCDMLDGTVARTKKDRTVQEKQFGIQIDSLCDCVSFGVQPAVFLYFYAKYYNASQTLQIIATVVGACLLLCAIIRLAYFNVMEEERQHTEGNKRRTGYQGLPVTNVIFMVPIGYLANYFCTQQACVWVMVGMIALTAFLFVLNFRMFKSHGIQNVIISLIALGIFIAVALV